MKSRVFAVLLLWISGQNFILAQQQALCLVSLGQKSCQSAFGDPNGSQYCSHGQLCVYGEWGAPKECPGNQTEIRLNPNWETELAGSREAQSGEPGWSANQLIMKCKIEKKCVCVMNPQLNKKVCQLDDVGNWVTLSSFTYGESSGGGPCVGGGAE